MFLKFKHTPLQTALINSLLRQSPTFKNCFTKNITSWFWEDLKHHSHRIIILHGKTGSFKSSIGLILGQKQDKTFSAHNVGFSNTELIEISKNSKRGMAFMRDENVHEYGQGSGVRYGQIINISEQLRARENSLIYISPTLREKIETAHYILHTIDATHTEMEVADMEHGRRKAESVYVRAGLQEPTTEEYIGSVLFKLEINSELWKEYMIKKKEFLEIAPKMQYTSIDYEQVAEDTLKKLNVSEFLNEKGKINKGRLKIKFKQLLANQYSANETLDIYTCAIGIIEVNKEVLDEI